MACKLCESRPAPANYGSPRRCAFDASGRFKPCNNWNCETMNEIRGLMGSEWDNRPQRHEAWRTRVNDQSHGVLLSCTEDDTILIFATWYKNRGECEMAWELTRVHRPEMHPLTQATAEALLEQLLTVADKLTEEPK